MLLLQTILILLSFYQAQGCQPELSEDAASLVTVGYDRQRTTAVYVNTLSVEMKNRKKFSNLLKSGCNKRRDATVTIEMRKEATEEWEEKARDIRITAKYYDKVKDLDPCSKYEIKILIKPKNGGETRQLPIFTVGPFHKLDPQDMAIAKFKGNSENYYNEHFQYEYRQVTEKSFTVKWKPICALMINVWVKEKTQEWEEAQEKLIINDIDNPTTEVTFDVSPCKVYDVGFEFIIDSEGKEKFEKHLSAINLAMNNKFFVSNFSKESYDIITSVLRWDYTALINELKCIENGAGL